MLLTETSSILCYPNHPLCQPDGTFALSTYSRDDLSVEFMDACVYLHAWLGDGNIHGIAEFPFARLYPVKGGLYNVSVRRLIDWSRVEDSPIWAAQNLFWNQAPNAKFWVKIARHKTFEEAMDALARDPNF